MKKIFKAIGGLFLVMFVLLVIYYVRNVDSVEPAKAKEVAIVLPIIARQLALFNEECGRFPSEGEGLSILWNPKEICPKFSGDIRKSMQADPWGRPYVYELKNDGSAFDLISYGKDGKPGGSGYDKDIRLSELGGNH